MSRRKEIEGAEIIRMRTKEKNKEKETEKRKTHLQINTWRSS